MDMVITVDTAKSTAEKLFPGSTPQRTVFGPLERIR
jgi:hypothetical protein